MSFGELVKKSLIFYRRNNAAVLLSVVVCTAVIAGSLVLGDSVNNSLKLMVNYRLGNTQLALVSQEKFFTTELGDKLADELDTSTASILSLTGFISNSDNTLRANRIQLLGVGEDFYKIGGAANPFDGDNSGIVLNEPLAKKIEVRPGDEVLIRINKPSALPGEMALTPSSDLTISFRLKVTTIADKEEFGLFNLQANQIQPLNAFVSIKWLQEQLEKEGKANILLAGASTNLTADEANNAIEKCWRAEDAGLKVSYLKGSEGAIELTSRQVFIDQSISAAAMDSFENAMGILTYFVNELRAGDRATPYSMVSAMSASGNADSVVGPDLKDDEIIINQWLANDLNAQQGDEIQISYYVYSEMRKLEERSDTFRVKQVIPIEGLAADANLMPDFPGIADAENCRDWEPGIDINLDKIRVKDEEYWNEYKGTPKAFITLAAGQRMWANRYGNLTAIRLRDIREDETQITEKILSKITPASQGLFFLPVRQQQTRASGQGTDFSQLFLGFNMFLITAALVLTGLLFVFGIEKRRTEIGVELALGLPQKMVRKLYLMEGFLISIAGSVAGTILGLFYTKGLIYALGTVWQKAVAYSAISFYVRPATIQISIIAGMVISMAAIWLTLRKQFKREIRKLLDETEEWQFYTARTTPKAMGRLIIAIVSLMAAIALVIAASSGKIDQAGAFFGAGALLLLAGILFVSYMLKSAAGKWKKTVKNIQGLAFRNSARRSSRSLSVVAMMACGVFLVIAVGANRHSPLEDADKRNSGTGGFALYAETSVGLMYDLNSESGLEKTGIDRSQLGQVSFVQMRLKEGDDASCLNLNRAQRPRLLSVKAEQLQERGAFYFIKTIKTEKYNGWDLLNYKPQENVVAAVGDEATVRWALGKSVGDLMPYTNEQGQQFQLLIVGMLKNSVMQGSLVISEDEFVNHFPSQSGYRIMLIDMPEGETEAVSKLLSERLRDYGIEPTKTTERLAMFSSVENTYLSIFQILGGLGLILGSIGLGTVVLRNALDRRGELAMMRAVGFNKRELKRMLFYEHLGLLVYSMIIGIVSAIVAVSPVLKSPGAEIPYISLGITVGCILVSAIIFIFISTSLAMKAKLLEALRNE